MELDRYRTIKGEAEAKLTRKGSRFIALAYPVESLEGVKEYLDKVKRRYHDATHHCYAYRLLTSTPKKNTGTPKERGQASTLKKDTGTRGGIVARADDAGEPARSAGPPILQVIEGQGLLNILIIVVRYFGGTKLGIGGLIRAYGDAAKEALAQAEVVERVKTVKLRIRYPLELTGEVMRLLSRYRAEVEEVAYSDRPLLTATLPSAQSERFRRALGEITSGRVEFLQA